jgi:hypothetical protein
VQDCNAIGQTIANSQTYSLPNAVSYHQSLSPNVFKYSTGLCHRMQEDNISVWGHYKIIAALNSYNILRLNF